MKTRKSTEGMKVMPYVKTRDYVIGEILNITKTQYRKDKEILSGVIDLTVQLQCAEPDANANEFLQDLYGFMMWAGMTNQPARTALTTIIHDLGEFARNRHEDWFCPRTSGYRKYLSGATNVIHW